MQPDPGQHRLAGGGIAIVGLVQVPEEDDAGQERLSQPERRIPFGTTTIPFGLTKNRLRSSSGS